MPRFFCLRPLYLIITFLIAANATASATVVVDEATGSPLAGASVFNRHGALIGVTSPDGLISSFSPDEYPLTVRFIGYNPVSGINPSRRLVKMKESTHRLPEIEIDSDSRQALHILALVRDYSTLSTYRDTVILFREKWVDFMVPSTAAVKKIDTWRRPRILSTRSYYRFRNSNGLDSVSDRFNQHFSWSDWLGIIDNIFIPKAIRYRSANSDTIHGRYSPAEIWTRRGDDFSVYVDVLADTTSRRWVPDLTPFFRKNLDFENFTVNYRFNDVFYDYIRSDELTAISCHISSRGRGHNMFRYNRHDEPFFVTTNSEIYIVDREYISGKEANRWAQVDFSKTDLSQLPLPDCVPALSPDIIALIARVDAIDHDRLRLLIEPDHNLVGRSLTPMTTKQKILKRLKNLINPRPRLTYKGKPF